MGGRTGRVPANPKVGVESEERGDCSPSARAACIMTARLTVFAGTAVLGFPLCNHVSPVCRNISLQSNITPGENVLSFITIFRKQLRVDPVFS